MNGTAVSEGGELITIAGGVEMEFFSARPRRRSNANAPPKRGSRPREAASLKSLQQLGEAYRVLLRAQPRVAVRRCTQVRRCCRCGVFVGNSNLGGFSGKSALAGTLFCLSCADNPPPIFTASARWL
jgi:hypothetical protein